MDVEIRNQLEFFGMLRQVKFERIALTKSQEKTYGLPLNFESGEGYEVDALNAYNPKEFAKLIDKHVERHYDKGIHEQVLERQDFQSETIDARIRSRVKFLDEDGNGDED